VDTADNHLLHGFVASNNIQQVAVCVQSQQSAYIVCARVLVDYQHTFSIPRQSSREIDHGCSLSRTRTAGCECDNAQVILNQQSAQALCLVMNRISQGTPRAYPPRFHHSRNLPWLSNMNDR
jgi:hypothetical protein